MADFGSAFLKVVYAEGGYVNDPDDAGGETYMGITRKNHKTAEFWKVVDEAKLKYKTNKEITRFLKTKNNVTEEIKHIYKFSYWNKFNLDKCSSDKVAFQIFDTAVNMGPAKAQTIMNKIKNLNNLWK